MGTCTCGKCNAQELNLALKEYIQLLSDELSEVAPIAFVHGWRSNRFEEGKKLRRTLRSFGLEIGGDDEETPGT